MKYTGTKSYNTIFTHEGIKEAKEAANYTVKDLVPGTKYKFELYASSECGQSLSKYVFAETKIKGNNFLATKIL